jgi:hypothetical protein
MLRKVEYVHVIRPQESDMPCANEQRGEGDAADQHHVFARSPKSILSAMRIIRYLLSAGPCVRRASESRLRRKRPESP